MALVQDLAKCHGYPVKVLPDLVKISAILGQAEIQYFPSSKHWAFSYNINTGHSVLRVNANQDNDKKYI